MSEPPPRPSMPLGVVALLTVLVVVAAFLLLRWIVGTITFALNTLLLLAVLIGAGYLYLRYKSSR
jgi:hypothetical protein